MDTSQSDSKINHLLIPERDFQKFIYQRHFFKGQLSVYKIPNKIQKPPNCMKKKSSQLFRSKIQLGTTRAHTE